MKQQLERELMEQIELCNNQEALYLEYASVAQSLATNAQQRRARFLQLLSRLTEAERLSRPHESVDDGYLEVELYE